MFINKLVTHLLLCDDMRKANGVIVRERHPIPTVDKILFFRHNVCISSSRIGWWIYTDYNFCYWHKGNDVWGKLRNWHASGSNSASLKILRKCEKHVCDDIIVHGRTTNEHKRRLKKALERIQERGLSLNKEQEKGQFHMSELEPTTLVALYMHFAPPPPLCKVDKTLPSNTTSHYTNF